MATTTWRLTRGMGVGAHDLAPDETLRLRPARAELAVRVVAGCVLVTREGDPADHVLEPGDELRLTGHGLAVAWALSPARVLVSSGASAGASPAARRGDALAKAS